MFVTTVIEAKKTHLKTPTGHAWAWHSKDMDKLAYASKAVLFKWVEKAGALNPIGSKIEMIIYHAW